MLEKESMEPQVIRETKNVQDIRTVPDPKVRERAVRRRFTAEYKLRILKEAASSKEQGQIGSLLRREGLYSSNLITWRHQMEKGTLEALSPRKRGPKAKRPDPSTRRIAELERKNNKLKEKLKQGTEGGSHINVVLCTRGMDRFESPNVLVEVVCVKWRRCRAIKETRIAIAQV